MAHVGNAGDDRADPASSEGAIELDELVGHRAALVRIRAGALGNGLPDADLTVTGDHGMIVDGLVVNVPEFQM